MADSRALAGADSLLVDGLRCGPARNRRGSLARLVTVAPAFTQYYASPGEVKVPGCPWQIVQGDADEVVDAGQVAEWAGRIHPAPQLVLLPGVGHYFHGNLNALRAAVVPFLQ